MDERSDRIIAAAIALAERDGYDAVRLRDLAAQGKAPESLAMRDDPLDFLVHAAGAQSLTDAAYRFARHEPGADVVLFSTGNVDHVASNVESILRPPLPEADRERLAELFGALTGVGLVLPDRVKGKGV